jgi:hypothetical protein
LKKFIIVLALLFGLGYLGYYFYYIPYFDNNQMGITDINGQRVKFPQDKPYILCYIQTWCKDCISETPCLMDFSAKQSIPIYFVTDEDTLLLKKYRARFDYELPIYLTKTRLKEKGILLFPTAFFYGRNNQLLYNKMERIDSAELVNYLGKLNK